jgi:hypothetical protein
MGDAGMKLFKCLGLVLVVLIFTPKPQAQTAKADALLGMNEFVQDWEISKQFTLEVANAMPAELYSFRPNAGEMSFGVQIMDIAGSFVFRFQLFTGIEPPFPFNPAQPPSTDKATAIKLLEQSFDYVLKVQPEITSEQLKRTWNIPSWKGRTNPDGRAMILNMFVHTAHHRAQCQLVRAPP